MQTFTQYAVGYIFKDFFLHKNRAVITLVVEKFIFLTMLFMKFLNSNYPKGIESSGALIVHKKILGKQYHFSHYGF